MDYDQAVCKSTDNYTIYTRAGNGLQITTKKPYEFLSGNRESKIDVDYLKRSPRIRTVLEELGVLTKSGVIRKDQNNKLIQIKNFINVIQDALSKMKGISRLHILDAACGKSYLSFLLYNVLRDEWGYDAHFHGVDTNERVLKRCLDIQEKLSYQHMEFSNCAIYEFNTKQKTDIMYSLHGCDTATDEAIGAGVRLNCEAIIVVPCCHFELRSQLRSHPLKGITKYGLFNERFAALLTDALRSLALEACGYEVKSFRFVTDDISPKNTLIRAIRRGTENPKAITEYYNLKRMFNVSPSIERFLPSVFTHKASLK